MAGMNTPANPDLPADLIRCTHAARLLGVSVSTVHRWIDSGRLRGWRVGGTRRVSRADCLSLPEKLGPPPKPPPLPPSNRAAVRAALLALGVRP